MKVAFLKGDGILDRLIQLWTWSKYSHCELIFSDDRTFGTSLSFPFQTEFCKRPHLWFWDIVEVNIPPEKEALIRKFCEGQVGKQYDWKAIFFSQILPFRADNPKKWICSEVTTAAFRAAGYLTKHKPCAVSPGKFSKIIKTI